MKQVMISKYQFRKSKVLSQLRSIRMAQASRTKSTLYLTPSVLCPIRSILMAQAKRSKYTPYLTPSVLSPIRSIPYVYGTKWT